MADQMQISFIESYIDETTSEIDRRILKDIVEELNYRLPKETISPGSICPTCRKELDKVYSYCPNCGQCLE